MGNSAPARVCVRERGRIENMAEEGGTDRGATAEGIEGKWEKQQGKKRTRIFFFFARRNEE